MNRTFDSKLNRLLMLPRLWVVQQVHNNGEPAFIREIEQDKKDGAHLNIHVDFIDFEKQALL